MSAKEQLINEVLADAQWREGSGGSMTSRLQNAEAAAACYEIIPYLEGLPDDDPRLEELESIWEAGLVAPDRDHDKVRAARIGFKGGPPAEPSAWLDAYVASYTGAGGGT